MVVVRSVVLFIAGLLGGLALLGEDVNLTAGQDKRQELKLEAYGHITG